MRGSIATGCQATAVRRLGAVIVIDNDGRRDVTVWGGIMTEAASIRGIAGTVINGVCRDVSASLQHRYPRSAGDGSCARARTGCTWSRSAGS